MEEKKFVKVGTGLMLVQNGRILLGLRHTNPLKADTHFGAGTWTMPGGKMEFGESPIECIIRETYEETGIKIEPNQLEMVSVYNDTNPGAQFITLGFKAEIEDQAPRTMEPDKIVKWDWFSLENLPTPMFPPSQHLIDNWLAKKIYQE